jgi:hypothetical protein
MTRLIAKNWDLSLPYLSIAAGVLMMGQCFEECGRTNCDIGALLCLLYPVYGVVGALLASLVPIVRTIVSHMSPGRLMVLSPIPLGVFLFVLWFSTL